MRRSHIGLSGVSKDNYPGLPAELKEFSYYYNDRETGHVLMAIPECLLKDAEQKGDLDMFECPVPVKYVLQNGYRLYRDHIICDVKYDKEFGLVVGEEYYEI
jgi:hypothetical protein